MKNVHTQALIANPVTICLAEEPLFLTKDLFENLILNLISVENAKDRLHFKYVSPEWIGNPGWYFWPKSKLGVYFLRLENAYAAAKGILESSFRLYYYPNPQEKVFDCYSFDEQLARVSAVFGHAKPECSCTCLCLNEPPTGNFSDLSGGTGLPVPEVRGKLNTWLFQIGDAVLRWESEQINCCKIEAPNRARTWACRDVTVIDQNGHTQTILKRSEIDRDIPAWKLCNDFLSSLLQDLHLLGFGYSLEEEQLDQTFYTFQKKTFRLKYCPT